jgi:gliding motility-associated-like protein
MEDEMAICDGSSVQLTADFGYDYYNWSTGQTTRTITVYEPGVYTVNVSNTYGDLVCSTEKTILVEESDSAVITEIATIDWSQNDNVIEVYVDGIGDYEYSIDNYNYQNSNVFSDLSVGEYTIYVRDKNGCGIVSEEVYLLYYPKYFTPNGDGVRDVWQVINAFEEPNNRLSIYDRYGKLIKTLKPNDFGWDGMYNGNKMPSSDYWFVLERENGKTYNGHFSLKR